MRCGYRLREAPSSIHCALCDATHANSSRRTWLTQSSSGRNTSFPKENGIAHHGSSWMSFVDQPPAYRWYKAENLKRKDRKVLSTPVKCEVWAEDENRIAQCKVGSTLFQWHCTPNHLTHNCSAKQDLFNKKKLHYCAGALHRIAQKK